MGEKRALAWAAAILLLGNAILLPIVLQQRFSAAVRQEFERDAHGWPVMDPEYPCGPVSISVVGKVLGKDISLESAKKAAPPDRLGRLSMEEMITALERLGFYAAGVDMAPSGYKECGLPLIVHLRDSHFAVMVTSQTEHVVLINPPHSPARRRLSSFRNEEWTGRSIVVGKSETELWEQLKLLGVST